jgi:hypothetical protein
VSSNKAKKNMSSDRLLLHSHVIAVSFHDDIALLKPLNKALLVLEGKELKNLFDTALRNNITRLVLDLSAAEYISSEALGAVAICWNGCGDGEKARMAVILSPDESNEVRNLFEIIGLSRTLGNAIKTSSRDAINYLREFA